MNTEYPPVETIVPYGSGYDKPRAVFRGPSDVVKQNVAEYFGVDVQATVVKTVIFAALAAHDLLGQYLVKPTPNTKQEELPKTEPDNTQGPRDSEPGGGAADKPKRSGTGRRSKAVKDIEEKIKTAGLVNLDAVRNVWTEHHESQVWKDNKDHFEKLMVEVKTEKGW